MRKASVQKLQHPHPLSFTVEACLPVDPSATVVAYSGGNSNNNNGGGINTGGSNSGSSGSSGGGHNTNLNVITANAAGTATSVTTRSVNNCLFIVIGKNEDRSTWRFQRTYNELCYHQYSFNDLKSKTGARVVFPTYKVNSSVISSKWT
jgi:hypothetical protein